MAVDESIELIGFDLDPEEKEKAIELIQKHNEKLKRLQGYEGLKLRLKISRQESDRFLHEIQGTLNVGKSFNTDVEDHNLYVAISKALEKLGHEAEHKQK